MEKSKGDPLQKLEAALFVSGAAVTKKHLMKLIACDSGQLEHYLQELSQKRKESGVVLVDDGTRVLLATNPSLEVFMKNMQGGDRTEPLSKAAQETLAIIAYAGPIAKIDLDFLRGVNTQYILRRLAVRGLISEKVQQGKRIAEVSADFLLHLGIQKTEELPNYETIRQEVADGIQSIKKIAEKREV